MLTLETIQDFVLEASQIYHTSIDKLIEQISSIYFQYPYLLILLLALVPSTIFFLLLLIKKTFKAFQSSSLLENKYSIIISNIIGWYFTSSIYHNVNLSLQEDFRSYETALFILASSFANTYLVMNFLKLTVVNAKDQFKSTIKQDLDLIEKAFRLLRKLTFRYLLLIIVVNSVIQLKNFSPWILVIYLYKLNKELAQLNGTNESILDYLFQDLPSAVKSLLTGPLRFVSLVYIIVSGLFYRLIFSLSSFEITKKLSAKIIRRQVERITTESSPVIELPKEYTDEFNSVSLKQYKPKWFNDIEEKMTTSILNWTKEKNTLSYSHLIGDPGSGRLNIISNITSKFKELNPSVIKVNQKITTIDELKFFLEKEVTTLSGKTQLVIIDNAENLFLNSPGRFEAVKELFKVIHNSEIFYINVFDYYPWLHIKDFLGNINTGQAHIVKGFSDKEISTLISEKNKLLKTKVIFDKAIYEVTNKKGIKGQEDNASTYYFRMIWEQSNGNPNMALKLWLESIRIFNKSENKIVIGLPKKKNSTTIKNISLDSLFVYNSLLKHSRLTFEQCVLTTNLDSRKVTDALATGQSEMFLHIDEFNHYYIKRSWYSTLAEILKTKNLIYG
jgi:hypothetical protein